jgi:hypothetical protein
MRTAAGCHVPCRRALWLPARPALPPQAHRARGAHARAARLPAATRRARGVVLHALTGERCCAAQ